MGWTFDVMDVALFNFAKVPLMTEILGGEANYKATGGPIEANLLFVLMLGWSVGGFFFGWLADRIGRMRCLLVTVLIYAVFTGLTAFCHTVEQLYVVRFLTGLGVGGEWAAGAALVAENVSEDKRARAASWLQSAAAFGPWFAAMINFALVGHGWRALFLVGVLPALATLFLRRLVSSSEVSLKQESPQVATLVATKVPWKRVAVGLALGTAGIASATNVSFWLPNIVKQLSPGMPAADIQSRQSVAALVLHIGTLAGVFLVPWLCSRLGRRLTLLLCFLVSPVIVTIVATVAKDFQALLLMSPLMALLGIGTSAAFVLYFPELFPSRHRAFGAGVSYNGGRVLAAMFPLLTAHLPAFQTDVTKSVAQTSLFLAFGAIALLFAPETKGDPLPA